MLRKIGEILSIGLLLVACGFFQKHIVGGVETEQLQGGSTISPSDTVPVQITHMMTLQHQETPQPISTVSFTDTPMPESTLIQTDSRKPLLEVIASMYWQKLGLPKEIMEAWQGYADGSDNLTTNQIGVLDKFLFQWYRLNNLATQNLVPSDATLGFRVKEFQGNKGEMFFTIYAVDEVITAKEGQERLFLVAHSTLGMRQALVLAPRVDRLTQQISPDGDFINYIDGNGEVILVADGRPLNTDSSLYFRLKESLDAVYKLNSIYSMATIYPRFRYPFPGMDAGFYAIDESLTYPQIILLKETLALFDRPEFKALRTALFNSRIAYLIIERIGGAAAGVTFTGTSVVVFDRRYLFGDKYVLASVVAHEASHVLQGALSKSGGCVEMLRREIGDKTIPEGFYDWTADQLIQAIKGSQIGAYHVSLWMLYRLGVKDIGWLQETIRTGKVGSLSVVNCQP
jgi:hypothetical protein